MPKKLISNLVSAISSRVVGIVVGVASVPLHLNYWGIEQYGLYITILSVLAFVPLSGLGLIVQLVFCQQKPKMRIKKLR